MKHVNPFEVTFRQAIDSKTKLTTQKSLEIIKSNDEDTLHTPHIIQKDITDSFSIKKTDKDWFLDKSSITTPEILSTEKIDVEKVDTEPSQPEQSDHSKDDDEATIKVRKVQSQIIKKTENSQKILRKICPKPIVIANINPIKEKIRESLLKLQTTRGNNVNTNVVIHSTDAIAIVEPPISSTGQLKNIEIPVKNEIKRKVANKGIRKFQDDGSNERNRAAAKRYRNKQKLLYDNLLTRNAQLETENAQLKKQLQHFKKIHANCSMTRSDNSLGVMLDK